MKAFPPVACISNSSMLSFSGSHVILVDCLQGKYSEAKTCGVVAGLLPPEGTGKPVGAFSFVLKTQWLYCHFLSRGHNARYMAGSPANQKQPH